jgi:hypothetical protein
MVHLVTLKPKTPGANMLKHVRIDELGRQVEVLILSSEVQHERFNTEIGLALHALSLQLFVSSTSPRVFLPMT